MRGWSQGKYFSHADSIRIWLRGLRKSCNLEDHIPLPGLISIMVQPICWANEGARRCKVASADYQISDTKLNTLGFLESYIPQRSELITSILPRVFGLDVPNLALARNRRVIGGNDLCSLLLAMMWGYQVKVIQNQNQNSKSQDTNK